MEIFLYNDIIIQECCRRLLMHEEVVFKSFLYFNIFILKKDLTLIKKYNINMLIILNKVLQICFTSFLWERHSCIFDVC